MFWLYDGLNYYLSSQSIDFNSSKPIEPSFHQNSLTTDKSIGMANKLNMCVLKLNLREEEKKIVYLSNEWNGERWDEKIKEEATIFIRIWVLMLSGI